MESSKRRKYQITAISDALTDIIVQVNDDILERIGLTKGNSIALTDENREKLAQVVAAGKAKICPGGSPTNTIYGASNLGMHCAFIGCVGSDDYGYDYINNLRENDIDTYVSIKQGNSGLCYTLISPDGQRTFGLDFGVAKQVYPYEILHTLIKDSEYLHFSAYEFRGDNPINVATRHAAEIARKAGTKISFDLADSLVIGRFREKFTADLFGEPIDVLFANEDEAKAMCDGDDFSKLLQYSKLVVVKLGSKGAVALCPDGTYKAASSYKVDDVIDTNGAGDNFQAGFFYGMIKGLDLTTCLKIGNFLAANIIRRIGAQSQVKISGIEYFV